MTVARGTWCGWIRRVGGRGIASPWQPVVRSPRESLTWHPLEAWRDSQPWCVCELTVLLAGLTPRVAFRRGRRRLASRGARAESAF
jgi:hypothetical protein